MVHLSVAICCALKWLCVDIDNFALPVRTCSFAFPALSIMNICIFHAAGDNYVWKYNELEPWQPTASQPSRKASQLPGEKHFEATLQPDNPQQHAAFRCGAEVRCSAQNEARDERDHVPNSCGITQGGIPLGYQLWIAAHKTRLLSFASTKGPIGLG